MYKGFNTSVLKYILVIVVPEYIMKIDLVMHRPRSTFNLKKKLSSLMLIDGALKI